MKNKYLFLCVLSGFISLSVMAQPARGSQTPSVVLPNTSMQQVSIESLKGKVVLVDFWASWCGPCRRSMPELKRIHQQFGSQGFEVYGISLDTDKNNWLKALKTDGIPGIQVVDQSGAVANEWKVSMIPTTFLIDKKGIIRSINPSKAETESLIPKLLAEKG